MGKLKRWQRLTVWAVGIIAILFAASYLCPIRYEICDKPDYGGNQDCYQYHPGPYVIAWLINAAQDYNGLITAIATVFIAWFTLTLRKSSDRLANISEQQTNLLNAQRLIDHRPRLNVRHVSLASEESGPGDLLSLGEKFKGGLAVVNVGGTQATIINSFYTIFFSRTGLPMASPLDIQINELIWLPKKLGVGESVACQIEGVVAAKVSEDSFIELKSRNAYGWTIYVMGQIEYSDDAGNHRFMGFCRQWGGGPGTFQPVSDQDYEYQD